MLAWFLAAIPSWVSVLAVGVAVPVVLLWISGAPSVAPGADW